MFSSYYLDRRDGHVYPNKMNQDDVPVLVIDIEDREQISRLWLEYAKSAGGVDNLRAVLASMLQPPKPDEPLGLGAVVRDSRGVRWVRSESAKGITNPWQATLHPLEGDVVRQLAYDRIDAVEVLSEGVR